MTDHDVDILEEDLEAEEELTPQELLELDIIAQRAFVARTGNRWHALTLAQMEEYLKNNFDSEGEPIPPEGVVSELTVDFSPQAAQDATGWWTHIPIGFGNKLPPRFSKSDPELGLRVSNERHAGCVLIHHQQVTADRWMSDPEGVAAEISRKRTSKRLFAMAGHKMNGRWYSIPMFDHGGFEGLIGYAMQPEIEINDEEELAYRQNWGKYHFKGMHSLLAFHNVVWNPTPGARRPDWKDLVDPVAKAYKIPTIVNKPNWIVPALMGAFNTNSFMRGYYGAAKKLAKLIDRKQAVPVPGYEEQDAAYRAEFEENRHGSVPFTPVSN